MGLWRCYLFITKRALTAEFITVIDQRPWLRGHTVERLLFASLESRTSPRSLGALQPQSHSFTVILLSHQKFPLQNLSTENKLGLLWQRLVINTGQLHTIKDICEKVFAPVLLVISKKKKKFWRFPERPPVKIGQPIMITPCDGTLERGSCLYHLEGHPSWIIGGRSLQRVYAQLRFKKMKMWTKV